MNRTLHSVSALGAAVALSIGLAACGDDDESSSPPATTIAGSGSPAAAPEAPASAGGDEKAFVVADCEALFAAFDAMDEPQAPAVGEAISDEYRQFLENQVRPILTADYQSEAVHTAVAPLAPAIEAIIAAETWTADFDTAIGDGFDPLDNLCSTAVPGDPAGDATGEPASAAAVTAADNG